MVFSILAMVFGLGALVCAIFILIHAFKNTLWKGLLGLFCGIYLLIYAFTEFEHEKKWQIIGGWLACAILGGIFNFMGAAQIAASAR